MVVMLLLFKSKPMTDLAGRLRGYVGEVEAEQEQQRKMKHLDRVLQD